MAALPKLDTDIARPQLHSARRSSYASASDESSKNSWASTESAACSLSSWKDAHGSVSSFSRTVDTFSVDSAVGTPSLSPVASSGASLSVAKDGPTAVSNLQNVKNVVCVAFGAFDRYYLSWEDNDGEFHQGSNNLPPNLQAWLFPPSGDSRDLATLQVAFTSNDDWFASDCLGKASSRDIAAVKDDIATRKKANTISGPASQSKESQPNPRLQRRRTSDGASSMPINKDSRLTTEAIAECAPLGVPKEASKWDPIRRRNALFGAVRSLQLSTVHDLHGAETESGIVQSKLTVGAAPHEVQSTERSRPDHTRRRSGLFGALRSLRVEPIPLTKNPPVEMFPEKTKSQDVPPQAHKSSLEINSEIKKSTPENAAHTRSDQPLETELFSRREEKVAHKADIIRPPSSYVTTGTQTDLLEPEIISYSTLGSAYHPSSEAASRGELRGKNGVTIGSMQDLFRGQRNLGDALWYL